MANAVRLAGEARTAVCFVLLFIWLGPVRAETVNQKLFNNLETEPVNIAEPGFSDEVASGRLRQPTDTAQDTGAPPSGAAAGASGAPPDRRDLIYYPGDTEHPWPLIKKLGQNVLLDQKAIWTSPFHIRRRNAKWWIGSAAIAGALIATDRRTIRTFENSPAQIRWGNNISHLGAPYTVLPVMVGFYTYGAVFDNQKARETGILGGEALLDGLITVEVMKVAFQRNRPNAQEHPGNFWGGGASFPSGHSIEVWALASVIAHEYRNRKFVPYLAFGLASIISGARFAAQQHYASDIFVGAAGGFFIGRYVVNTHEAHAGHHHGIITPIVQPADRTFGLSYSFGL